MIYKGYYVRQKGWFKKRDIVGPLQIEARSFVEAQNCAGRIMHKYGFKVCMIFPNPEEEIE